MNNSRRKRIQKVFDSLVELRAELEEIRNEEQDAFDNMPEGIQESERGEMSQSAIDNLDSVIGDLENIDDTLQEVMT